MADCEHGAILEAIETNQGAIRDLAGRQAVDVSDMVWVKKAIGIIVWAAGIVATSVLGIVGLLVSLLVRGA